MNLGSSYDECGPLIPLGQTKFSAETGLPGGRQTFEVPLFRCCEDESQVIVEYNGMKLADFGTWNDYYGFGSSPETALYEAQKSIARLDGCNADILVVTTLTYTPCFPSSDEPFYNGAQRIHHIPYTWRSEGDVVKRAERQFVVWKNGERTREALEFYDEIIRLSSQDDAPQRKGDLRTVAARKEPTSRDAFLRTATETT